ncbi:hypothetical protein GCM10023086_39270 [Streptomyces venetus]|uniref:MFS transporter n=1 Tax=Streptomyces venetus TaxID=1701086 RepID=A0ABP8G3G5_9ACTN
MPESESPPLTTRRTAPPPSGNADFADLRNADVPRSPTGRRGAQIMTMIVLTGVLSQLSVGSARP